MRIPKSLQKLGVGKIMDYISKDPEKNLPKLMDWVDKFAGSSFESQRRVMGEAIRDEDNLYHGLIMRVLNDIDTDIIKTLFINFFMNANLVGGKRQNEIRAKYGCNSPWAILLDPTSACNLHCTGCWAAEYGNKLNLSFDEIDDLINQGKDLGIYIYIYTGGEPLVRKDDIIKLCEKHNDCEFLCFTNATLIDEKFADDMLRVKNFVPAISLEGFREATDSRRGEGTYDRVIAAMRLLKSKKLPFGVSCCYTSKNFESIMSEEFYDFMIELGAVFVWYFHYMPVGNDADVELMMSPEQRVEMYRRLREFRSRKQLFAMDFQNDAEFVDGCIAGGKKYLHINANGDVDPCVFIHYSDSNIREKPLLDALRSPLFMAYHEGQPFNDNMLRPCPMLENPQKLREIIEKTGAHSTDMASIESAEHLCAKCDAYAEHWKPVAEALWKENREERAQKAAAK